MNKLLTKILLGVFTVFLFAGASFAVVTNSTSIRLQQPGSPTNLDNFNITFVALDTNPSQAVTVQCYKKGPIDGSFTPFGSPITLSAGGNTDNCLVTSGEMNEGNGTYAFRAVVITGSTNPSANVSVDFNNSTPGTPTNYNKSQLDSCTYRIKFRTADDSGKTIKAEVYRSTDTSFNLDDGNRVATANVGSSTDVSIDNVVADCSKTNYYAVRAFDSFGNGSGVVGDEGINVTFTTSGTTTTATLTSAQGAGGTTGGGAIAVGGAGLPAGAEVLGTEAAKVTAGKPQQPGEALGAAAAQKGFFSSLIAYLKNPYILLAILVLLVVVYVFRKKAKNKPL